MKTFVLIISKKFPTKHSQAGNPTYFAEKIARREKIHTIRENYELWRKRIIEVRKGLAEISLRQWSGAPYNSPQFEIERLTKEHDIGIQRVRIDEYGMSHDKISIYPEITRNVVYVSPIEIAKNDGLTLHDFADWFKVGQKVTTGGIIHFTSFRY